MRQAMGLAEEKRKTEGTRSLEDKEGVGRGEWGRGGGRERGRRGGAEWGKKQVN